MKKVLIHSFFRNHLLYWDIKYIGNFEIKNKKYKKFEYLDIYHFVTDRSEDMWVRIFDYNDFIDFLSAYSNNKNNCNLESIVTKDKELKILMDLILI